MRGGRGVEEVDDFGRGKGLSRGGEGLEEPVDVVGAEEECEAGGRVGGGSCDGGGGGEEHGVDVRSGEEEGEEVCGVDEP